MLHLAARYVHSSGDIHSYLISPRSKTYVLVLDAGSSLVPLKFKVSSPFRLVLTYSQCSL